MDEFKRDELVSYALVSDLAMFLRTSGSTLCLSEAIMRAVKLWMAAQSDAAAPIRGYQWKSLFLPSGTRLRMCCAGQTACAQIVDDELIFHGRPTSPRQMTVAVAGEGRNAWPAIWVQRPGEKDWTLADKLRRPLVERQAVAEASPAEAIQLAARSMSEALQTALLLVDQSHMRAEQQVERRVEKHRRRDDQLDDACLED